MKKIKKVYLFVIILLLLLAGFTLKTYADKLKQEGQKELYSHKDRIAAIKKLYLAQIVWFPYKFDENYQNFLLEVKRLEGRPAIIIFIQQKTRESEIQNLIQEIRTMNGVKEVKSITQEEALKIYRDKNKNDRALLSLVTADILPASIGGLSK